VNRADLQQLAELRLAEARVLLTANLFGGAYYLAGYAIECALKACVAKQIREFDFPDKRLVERSYTHNLAQLLEVSGVKGPFEEEVAWNHVRRSQWEIVRDWTEASRYDVATTEEAARDMLAAVGDENNGILVWLKQYW
jgi:hypothetical protein